ncbi:chitinase [Mycobacterium sp. RTGN5]|uniref:chitinase n=1 Tax=Mycobacterium sp. RTGN5 TaxID=3016522 RepID=UPI0029C99618|nr:Calx-beta domain-containing protein [Mycobacterium sp. RTGN5]
MEQVSSVAAEPLAASVPKALVAPARQTATVALSPADLVKGFLSLFGLKGLPPSPVQLLTGMLALIRREIESFLHPSPAVPKVSITDTSLVENTTWSAAFTVTLSKASTKAVTVTYTTADGSATAGQDYAAGSGTVTFAPGVTSQQINVALFGDTTVEPTETFTVTLANPSGVTIGRATGTATITDDDATVPQLPTVSIDKAVKAEGNSGTSNMTFTVTLSKAATAPVTVNYATANGTATAGQDYTAATGTVTFAAGQTTKTITVAVIGDATVETDENFTVTLSNPTGATIAGASAVGTIANDDVAVTPPNVSIGNANKAEGNSGTSNMTFTVTLSKAATVPITVDYATSNGTATAGQDYTAATGTVTFAAGETTKTIAVAVAGDATVEPTETFTVALSNATGATIVTASAIGTITNDDTATPGGKAQWGKTFFAPYVDMGAYPVPNLLALSKTYGTSLVTLGFMQVDEKGNLAWAGLSALEPNSTNEQAIAINQSIATFKAAGGDVMISFGGASGTSIAQYYAATGRSAQELADAYAAVVDTYGVTHLDFDIEGAAAAEPASITLTAQALALLQKAKPEVQIWYTLPVLPTGLTADGVNVVAAALKAGVNLAGVNVMAMDYGESAAPTSGPNAKTMGAYAIEAAESTYAQVSTLYTAYSKTFGWNQIGVTPMLGVNDVMTEVFTVADAQALEDFARTKGIGMLAMWQVLRDNPGTLGQSTTGASGLSDPLGAFSNVFNDYGTINVVDYTNAGPGGGSGGVGGTPVTGGTSTTIGWAWGANPVLTFDPAKDTLDFVWMQAKEFDVSDTSGSTVITIVGNNSSYTLAGVTLSQLQLGNIIAKDAGTLTKWQGLIAAAKAV